MTEPGGTPRGASPPLEILVPMSLEARAVRAGAPWARVHRIGIGPRRAARTVRTLRDTVLDDGAGVVIAGFCGALDDRLAPGDVVLASTLTDGTELRHCPDPTILAGVLRRGGLRVSVGAVAASHRPVIGRRREELRAGGAIAVDMESLAAARALGDRPLFVLRIVLDTPHHELHRPLRAARATVRSYRALRRASRLLEQWAPALGPREVVLASPRASCAGVERAIQIVERALEDDGPPVYVRRQIVHNAHVIAELEQHGAVFVEEVDEVPPGAKVIFSAHGVSPAVREQARNRGLDVIDATCPLVAKVHAEARRFSANGYEIVLVGHAGHEEVDGTQGEAPERTHVVGTVDEVQRLDLADPDKVAYLTQTTLAIDDTVGIVDALRERFPALSGPRSSDICYATQNRQDAVRALAAECDVVLVIGSGNSSNSRRLVEVSERAGAPAVLIEDGGEIEPARLAGARRIGVTAGASAPESLVVGVLGALSGVGASLLGERMVATEQIKFRLPPG